MMPKISFQLKFDTKVDSKGRFNKIEKFWEKFFIKNITENLVHRVDFDKRMAINCGESKKKLASYNFAEFRSVAENTTQEIKDSVVYNIVGKDGNIQDIHVSFSINYNVPESSQYCSSINDYLNKHIISTLVYQTEEMQKISKRMATPDSARVIKMDEHFLELLNQMQATLKIETPKKEMKM